MGKTEPDRGLAARDPAALFVVRGQDETADTLIITLQPDAYFCSTSTSRCRARCSAPSASRSASADDRFPPMPEAYETLLLDVFEGDQTLFVHADEVEESWRLYTPVLETGGAVHAYPAGTWGPPEADLLALPDPDLWQQTWGSKK
jgi:glucose-6-phosphate 1-dehydrogenase